MWAVLATTINCGCYLWFRRLRRMIKACHRVRAWNTTSIYTPGTTSLSQMHSGGKSSDSYIRSAATKAQRRHSRHLDPPRGLHLPLPSSQLSVLPPPLQLPVPPTSNSPQPQPSDLENSSGSTNKSPFHVNTQQSHRIPKRRAARLQLEERLKAIPGVRKPYIYESRHRYAMRRPRGPRGRFLPRDEMEGQEISIQNGTLDKPQTPEMRTEWKDMKPGIIRHIGKPLHANTGMEAGAAPLALISAQPPRFSTASQESGTFERRSVYKMPKASQISEARTKDEISKAMTTLFYGPDKLNAKHNTDRSIHLY